MADGYECKIEAGEENAIPRSNVSTPPIYVRNHETVPNLQDGNETGRCVFTQYPFPWFFLPFRSSLSEP